MTEIIKLLKDTAAKLKVDYTLLLAITKVESNGNGFLSPSKPVVLFERHIFYKQLKKQGLDIDSLSKQYPLLVNQTAGGYQGGQREYFRLNMAKQINESCAIESTSYGLFQIMGFHWQTLGYQSAQDFEMQMCESELKQTDAFIRFISLKANNKMIVALQNHNYSDFAKLYNGPNFKKNRYDEKIKAAYEQLKLDSESNSE